MSSGNGLKCSQNFDLSINMALVYGGCLHYMDMKNFLKKIYAPTLIDRGHIVLPVSVHLSAENLTVNLTFSYNFHSFQVTMLIFSMQVAFDNTQLVRIISSRSRLNIKVTFFRKWLFQGHFPSKSWFLRVCSTSLLKTLREKEKLIVTSNFCFSHSVFYLF